MNSEINYFDAGSFAAVVVEDVAVIPARSWTLANTLSKRETRTA